MADQAVRDFDRFGYDLIFNADLPVSFLNYTTPDGSTVEKLVQARS